MKNVLKIALFTIMTVFMVNCSSNETEDLGNTPGDGWRLGSTNYSTTITQRVATGSIENSITALDLSGGASNLHVAYVIFNEGTGISAGTYKVVQEITGELPKAGEIVIGAGTGYNNSTSVYESTYYAVPGQNVNATVTITGGKAKIVIPQINVAKWPYSSTSEVTTFAGTIVEK